MNHVLVSKLQHALEACFLFLAIHWQPVFGVMASCMAVWYYAAMIKMNIVDKEHGGSWRSYIKTAIKKLFKK